MLLKCNTKYPVMDAISVLPSDLIVDILTLLPDRSNLYHAICVNKSLKDAFDSRRSLILSRVFERELFHTFGSLVRDDSDARPFLGSSQYLNVDGIRKFQSFCQKLTQRPHDALTLSLSAWRVMGKCRIRVRFFLDFAERLLNLCEATHNDLVAFNVAEDTWHWILEITELHGTNWLARGNVSQPADGIIKRLATMLSNKDRAFDATQILFEYHEIRDFNVDTNLLRTTLALIKLNPESTFATKFIEALKLRATQGSWREVSKSYRDLPRHYLPAQSCLNITYLALNRIDESVALLQNAIRTMDTPSEVLAILAMSRRVVKSLKQLKHGQTLMTVRQSVEY